MPDCAFCNVEPARVIREAALTIALRDGFPVSDGHALVVPRRHVVSWADATLEEKHALVTAIDAVRALVDERHGPDGYNIGFNDGAAAGQTVMHLHVHVSERRNLATFARLLRDHQRAACLHCGGGIPQSGDVDHFIAWSRYPADLGHNLVLAHRGCNAKKRDFLAHPRHVETWYRTHIERADELAQRCDEAGPPCDAERTRTVAWWAYEQGERAGAHAWIRDDELERLGRAWRGVLGRVPLQRVAEREPPSYDS